MNAVGDFFRALPEVLRSLWTFGDGFYGLTIMIVSVALTALFLLLAHRLRAEHTWLSAVFGSLAITILFFWGFGVLPSAWVYFVDGSRDLLEGTLIPSALPGMTNFYQVFRDLVVLIETGIAMTAFVVVALLVQRRLPKGLAEGEEARPQSGGYK